MKWLASIAMSFLCFVLIQAQDETKKRLPDKPKNLIPINEYEEECGNPFVESQTYTHRWGKVIKVLDGKTIVFEVTKVDGIEINKSIITVSLAGIDTSTNEEGAKKFLLENLLNETVKVVGNTGSPVFFAIVWGKLKASGNLIEVNLYLLEKGIAKFKAFTSDNLVPYRTPCVYQKVEEKARQEKIGIWEK